MLGVTVKHREIWPVALASQGIPTADRDPDTSRRSVDTIGNFGRYAVGDVEDRFGTGGAGHRRIAAISGSWTDAGARIAALHGRLAERNIPLPESWVISMSDDTVVIDDILQTLMASPEPPTALFCWHDRVGYQMLEACERDGIAVPQQLTLAGKCR